MSCVVGKSSSGARCCVVDDDAQWTGLGPRRRDTGGHRGGVNDLERDVMRARLGGLYGGGRAPAGHRPPE
jgi:hypothetical protein